MAELEIDAARENLGKVFDFVTEELKGCTDDGRLIREFKLCVEEIFLNISSYAYYPDSGKARIQVRLEGSPKPTRVVMVFMDSGHPFDPLAEDTPDLDSDLEVRKIGGLGIYLVKNMVDGITYEYTNGKNVLTFVKEVW